MSQDQHERLATGLQATIASSFVAELFFEIDRIFVTARGQIDLNSRPILALALAKAIAADRREVVVDLEGVESVDSEIVGLLVRAKSMLQTRGQHLVVRSSRTGVAVLAACTLVDASGRFERADGIGVSDFSAAST